MIILISFTFFKPQTAWNQTALACTSGTACPAG